MLGCAWKHLEVMYVLSTRAQGLCRICSYLLLPPGPIYLRSDWHKATLCWCAGRGVVQQTPAEELGNDVEAVRAALQLREELVLPHSTCKSSQI